MMEFEPKIDPNLKVMDSRIFMEAVMKPELRKKQDAEY